MAQKVDFRLERRLRPRRLDVHRRSNPRSDAERHPHALPAHHARSARPPLGIGGARSHRRGRGLKRVEVHPKTPTVKHTRTKLTPGVSLHITFYLLGTHMKQTLPSSGPSRCRRRCTRSCPSMVTCPLPTSTDDPRGPYSAALLSVVGHDGPLQTVVMVLGCRRKHELYAWAPTGGERRHPGSFCSTRLVLAGWICRRHAGCMELLVMAVLPCSLWILTVGRS